MNQNIKYTTDGKKVVVIGALNTKESIVQEIFVIDGKEIPSGENFVVKSLHDAPAVSWKEDQLNKLEKRYETEYKNWQSKFKTLNNTYNDKCNRIKGLINYSDKFIKQFDNINLDLLKLFLTGGIKYIVIEEYYEPQLIEYEEFNIMYEGEALKLLSLFGQDDGTLSFRIHTYSDHSGGYRQIYPFGSYEEALEKFKEIVVSRKCYSEKIIDIADKYNIQLDKDKLEAYKANVIESRKEWIEKRTKEIDEALREIENVKNL